MLTVTVGLDASGNNRTLQAVGQLVFGDPFDRGELLDPLHVGAGHAAA